MAAFGNSYEIIVKSCLQKCASERGKKKHATHTYPVRESHTMTMLFGPMSAVTTQRR